MILFHPFPFRNPIKSEIRSKYIIQVYLCGMGILFGVFDFCVWVWHIPCSMCIFVFVKLIISCSLFSCSLSLSLLFSSMFSQYLLYADTSWVVLLRWHNFFLSLRLSFIRSFSGSVFRFQFFFSIIILSFLWCVFIWLTAKNVDFQFSHLISSVSQGNYHHRLPGEECPTVNIIECVSMFCGLCLCQRLGDWVSVIVLVHWILDIEYFYQYLLITIKNQKKTTKIDRKESQPARQTVNPPESKTR